MASKGSSAVGRNLLRVGGGLGAALIAFVVIAELVNGTFGDRLGSGLPDWVMLAVPAPFAVGAFAAALRAPLNRWTVLLLGLGVACLMGAVIGSVMAIDDLEVAEAGMVPTWLVLLLSVPLAGGTLAAMVPWWNRTDEAARQAHTSAFFWGGSGAGAAVTPLVLLPLLNPDSVPEIASLTPQQAFFAGAMVLYSAMCVGYVLFWAWWWLSRTSFAGRS